MSLDALKAMRAAMKAEKQAVTEESGKKYVTKADLEAAKLKRIRAEEDQERQEKASDNQCGVWVIACTALSKAPHGPRAGGPCASG